jgi:phosphomannomutase
MKINSNIFKAYDIRGRYPAEINERAVLEIAKAIGSNFNLKAQSSKLKAKVVVAHDARLSSYSLYKAVLSVLKAKSSKLKAIPVGLATTPMFYFLVNKLKASGGIMVTASHNPKEYNGLKVVGKNAKPISGQEILNLVR